MAGAPNATAFAGSNPAASACSASQGQMPQPSGMMIGPSTTQCYIRPMQFNTLPQGFNQAPSEGQYGYGYYDPNNGCNYLGTYGEYRNIPLGGFHAQGNQGASRANAQSICCCFVGEATTPVNACGYDAGGVPITFAALTHYDSPGAVAANTSCVWNNLVHAEAGVCQAQTAGYAEWLGLEGASRGLCIPKGVTHCMPNGFCVGPHGSCGACNVPGQGPINYPGCLQTFAHEFQELLNTCGASADNSDERNNGVPNNFKCCGTGYTCFDNAFQQYWGNEYGYSPCAWTNAKTCAYKCGALIGPGNGPGPGGPGAPGGPGTPGNPGGPIVIEPGCITIHPQVIPQAHAATSCMGNCARPGRKRMPKPQSAPNSPYPYSRGGMVCLNPYQQLAGGGTAKRLDCSAHAAPAPAPKPQPVKAPPICITIPNPVSPGAPQRGAIVPFVSASPAYPYRGTVCANKITYPGGETWNLPLGLPETPGGPGVPGPCAPPPAPAPNPGTGHPVIPITNNPGICGIQCINGIWTLIGPCGPLSNPICTGTPAPSPQPNPGPGHNPNPCGPGCGPCQPCGPGCNPCNPCQPNPHPNPCGPQPCGPCAPKPCGPCKPKPPCAPKSPFGCVSPYMPCYMGNSPWPSPQNVFGGGLPQTPWLPGGKVDNGLGPSPAMPASPVYGPAPADCAKYQGPAIPAPQMPFAAPSSTTTTTTTGVPCASGFPTFCQWNQRENCLMMANNYSQGGNCVWGLAANLQNGNIAFPTHTVTCTMTSPGLAPVTPGQCGNAAAYPGSDKWVGTNPNPYITQPAAPAPQPCGPSPCGPSPCGGCGPCCWTGWSGHAKTQTNPGSMFPGGNWGTHDHGGPGQAGGICYFQQNGQFNGPACFGGNQWANQGNWGGWQSPQFERPEDRAECFIGQNWCQWIQNDISKQGHGTPTTVTTQGAIPCWNPPNWNASTNPAFGNTSSPVGQGQFPSWPGQTNPGTGGPAPATGFYTPQSTPFLNGDLYHPGFETVGACFQGNPWQPTCLSLVNPGAISMGLAGFQLPSTPPPCTNPAPPPVCNGDGDGDWDDHATNAPMATTGSLAPTTGATGPMVHHAHGGGVGKMVDVELSPGENVHMPCGARTTVPGSAKYDGDTTKNDTYKTKLPSGAIVVPRTVSRDPSKEARFVAAIRASKSPGQALRRANG